MRIPAPALWILVAVITLVTQAVKSHDWQHLMWVTMLPLIGLVATSGSVLAAGKARIAALFLAAIGLMPLVMLSAKGGLDTHDWTAVESVPVATLEVVQFGFNGEMPKSMRPIEGADPKLVDSYHSPSRDVTVPMGGLYFGSIALLLVGVIVLISRAIPRGPGRTVWLSVSPLSVFGLVALAGGFLGAEKPLWGNDAWVVHAIGPLTAAAGVALVLVFIFADSPKSLEPEQ